MIEEINNIIAILEKGGRVNSHSFADLYFRVFNKKFTGAGCSSCVSDAVLRFRQYLAEKKRAEETVEHATSDSITLEQAEERVENYAKKNTKRKDQ